MTEKAQTSQTNGEFKKVLGLGSLICFGLAYMAPTVVFNYYGPMSVASNGMYPTVMVCTAVAMFFTAFSYANMAKIFQKSGSAYVYVQQSLNPHIGFMAGWVMLLDYLLLPMVCFLLVGVYMNTYVPAVPTAVWVVILVVACFLLNARGISGAAKADTVIVAAQLLVMAVFVVVGIITITQGGIGGTADGLLNLKAFYNPEYFEAKLILYPAAILCTSFLGFDAVSTLSEEAKNPQKDVPRAIVLVCLGAGLIFTLIAYIAQAMWTTGWQKMQDPDAGIFELLAQITVLPHMDLAFLIVDNIGSIACALSGQAAVIRIMYNMGRDNILPKKFFGKMNKNGVPVNNLIVVAIIGLVAIVFAENVMAGAELISFGAVTGFILVNVSVPVYFFKKRGERGGKAIFLYGVLPVIAVVVCGVLWVNMSGSAKTIGFVWLAVGLIILAVKTKGFRQLPPEMELE